MDVFRVRLNCVDHYQAEPTEFDPKIPNKYGNNESKATPRVPVIRVFGATETGQKVCAHIHGAFPYLYIMYNENMAWDEVNAYIRQLHLSIDHALAVSYRRNMYDGNASFVAHITLVKGIPFYGFHVGYKFFLKIYMLNPVHMTRVADLLRQGSIMKRVLQPYESHMQYLAQWMCDFNLYGCAYIDCSEVKFRNPVPDLVGMDDTAHRWHDRTIDASLISDEQKLPRQSHCSIEVDVSVQHIVNRLDVQSRPLHHDFIERDKPLEYPEKLVQSMAGLWRDETKRRKARMGDLDPGSSPFPPEVLVSVSADPRNSQPGGWIHETEYLEKVQEIMKDEASSNHGKRVDFASFVDKIPFERQVQTSLDSVEDLFPGNLARVTSSQRGARVASTRIAAQAFEQPNVDETRVMSFEEDELSHASDEELGRQLETLRDRPGHQLDRKIGQIAHKGLEKATYDSENRMSEVKNVRIVTKDGQPTSPNEPQGPNSSSELEALGIRNAGDYEFFEEDTFEIPPDCTSDLRVQNSGKQVSVQRERKRRKIHHGGHLLSEQAQEAPAEHQTSSLSIRTDNNLRKLWPKPGSDGQQVTQAVESQELDQQRGNHQRIHTSLSFSKEKKTGNSTLNFPVVKNPQDPSTIFRLSQSSKSPAKNSLKGNSWSASYKCSTTPGSAHSKGESFTALASESCSMVGSSQILQCSAKVHLVFDINPRKRMLLLQRPPPSSGYTMREPQSARLPSAIYQEVYYSHEKDVPDRAREYAGKEFKVESLTVPFLPDFDATGTSSASQGNKSGIVVDKIGIETAFQKSRQACAVRTWETEKLPPTREEVRLWLRTTDGSTRRQLHTTQKDESGGMELSQIHGPTQKNPHGFKYSQKQRSTSVQHETQYMSVMGLEIHVNTRGSLVPNPELDRIEGVFWCVQSDDVDLEVNGINEGTHVGIVVLSEDGGLAHSISRHIAVEVEEEPSELELIIRMVDIVRRYDPDILTGYEVHDGSWGYMIERARCKYDYNLCDEFSRMRSQSHGRFGKEEDRWGFNHTSTIRVTGRHMINIWRAMRGELNLLQYTMENVVFQLCHRRIPHFSFQDLTTWYSSENPNDLAKVVDYFVSRVQFDLEILEQNELVPRTSEQARLLGVDFFSVFSRGSQFKVESLMFRIAKPENFLLPSPSRKQVGQQNALECLPLVMEPQSAFYNSPLLVLDFQSLYPSVMIAYNYCYSTYLGRVVDWRGQNKMGFLNYEREPRLLELLEEHINIAPNGIMYTRPEIRKSLLAKMLGEILETRVMVKSGMKIDKDDKTLQRLLNNRQLALKLIANVTYGYTSASFSGRMPCSEIADSIVQTGRETLEKAIALIHSVERWGAEVVYGDTDSLFVYLKGRTKDEAFDIGQEIANTITDMNPRPVKLKFEKVYHPCVLLAKKRYVGFKYESKTQKVPEFDAKGIETVRRDGTPAEQKIEEKALKILFRTANLSEVKKYFQRQCYNIMRGKVSIQDFCFAKEVKLGTYSDKGLPPPGALISTKRMLEDPRAEPQYGERVPYVVIAGAPGARLIDRCVAPDVLLHNDNNELDAEYYISKNLVPPLERIFNLVGANVRQWYDEMPKHQRIRRIDAGSLTSRNESVVSKKTLESYMSSSTCLVCHEKLENETAICTQCIEEADVSSFELCSRLQNAETKAVAVEKVCRSCAGLAWGEDVKCDSKDCPVFYTRTRHNASLRSSKAVLEPVIGMLKRLRVEGLDW
ncbi:DNA polymerase zeta [Lecanora helva]